MSGTRHISTDFSFDLFIIQGDAVYTLDGTIFSLLPLYGEGDMWIELTNLDIKADAGLLIDSEGYLQVTGLILGAEFDQAVLHLDDLLGGGDFGEVINNLLSVLAPTIWDLVRFYLTRVIWTAPFSCK